MEVEHSELLARAQGACPQVTPFRACVLEAVFSLLGGNVEVADGCAELEHGQRARLTIGDLHSRCRIDCGELWHPLLHGLMAALPCEFMIQ